MATETVEDWISIIGVLLVVVGILIAPLTIFRRLRRFAGAALVMISHAFGIVLWIICAISVYAAWGAAALIVGILFFGVGPFLLAPVVYLVHADWENLGAYVIFMALLWAARIGGMRANGLP
jgi:hypothetical protein